MTFSKIASVFLISWSYIACAQEKDSIIRFKDLPLQNGNTVFEYTRPMYFVGTPNNTVDIKSKGSEVHSVNCGNVSSVSSISDEFLVIVKSNDSFFVYNGLSETSLKKGDKINKWDKIGELKQDPDTKEHIFEMAGVGGVRKKIR